MEQTIEAELAQARVARQQGNLGQVRVCARRAAAIAIRARYGWPGDALKRLRRLEAEPGTPAAVGAAAVRLTTKVGENHQLPFDNDPVEDARLIIAYLGRGLCHCEPRQGRGNLGLGSGQIASGASALAMTA